MKYTILIIMGFVYLTAPLMASVAPQNIQKLSWDGLEVVWLEDNRFPTFDLSIYFADGALSDHRLRAGETELAFSLLDSGTNRYGHKEITDALEFYGVSYGASVTHEYTSFSVSGLVKDVIPAMKMICHMFHDAIYPKAELSKAQKRMRDQLSNLVTSHGALADRVFRQLSLKGTPFDEPTGGTLGSLRRIKDSHLRDKLSYFNNDVKKRLYITGPKEVTYIKGTLLNECGWNLKKSTFARDKVKNVGKKFAAQSPTIYLIPVPDANQAQVRIGRYLPPDELTQFDLMTLASSYLGGGFTSVLMQETRVKRGLTYSIGAYAAPQGNYGRAAISTFTKNETVAEMLKVIEQAIRTASQEEGVPEKELEKTQGFLAGNFLFGLEQGAAFLSNLLFYDHIGREYTDLYRFPERVKDFSEKEVSQKIASLYDWSKQTIVVIGDKSLRKQLSKVGKVKVLKYSGFL